MEIKIIVPELHKLRQHARTGYPHEVVGILAGIRKNNTVSKIYPLHNELDHTHNRYKVSSLSLFRAEQQLEDEGLEIVGYYHSHPDHPSQYSDFDRDHALPNMSYVIISVQDGNPQSIQSWRLQEHRNSMLEENIVEIQSQP